MDLMRKAAKGAMQTIKFKDGKSMFKSKTFWAAACAFVIAGCEAVGYIVPPYALEMLMAFGLYGLRDAVAK